MKKILAVAVFALAACFLTAPNAEAQGMLCKERSEILDQLSTEYGESPAAIGLASNGSLIEVLTSVDDGKTWTIIITTTSGVSCVMATGESWQNLEQPVINKDPKS